MRELTVATIRSFPQGHLPVETRPEGADVRFVPVTDFDGTVRCYRERVTDSIAARGLTDVTAVRLAQFPLIEER